MGTAGDGTRRLITPGRLIFGALVLVAALAVVLVWFQPQKLFQDTRVSEAAPDAMDKDEGAMEKEDDSMEKDEGAMKKEEGAMKDEGMMLAGNFRSLDHPTSGTATLAMANDGHYYVRLEDFSTENGPDLVVYLSTAPASAEGREFAEDFVDLGALKGNIGDQNYVVPDGADIEKFKSVVIWCRRFTVPFGAAPLEST